MANLIQQLSDMFLRMKYPSDAQATPAVNSAPFAAQDRYLHTPITYNDYTVGRLGSYIPQGNPSYQLADTIRGKSQIDDETLRALDSVVRSWNSNSGYINMNPLYMRYNPAGTKNALLHEITHSVYDKGGLKDKAPDILQSMSPAARDQILNSPTYNTMPKPYGGSPEQVTDEGLAYANKDADAAMISAVANMLSDPKLRKTLLKIKGMGDK